MKKHFNLLVVVLLSLSSFSQSIQQEHSCCENEKITKQFIDCIDDIDNLGYQGKPPVINYVGIDTVVCDKMYVVYSGSSDTSNLNNVITTSNIFLLKGMADTVWIFGTGYGGRSNLTSPQFTSTRTALEDALDADSVIRNYFGINPTLAKIQFIVPHRHFDHVNWEFMTSLFDTIGYSRANTSIYAHANDYLGAFNNCSVLDQPSVQSLGLTSDPPCTTLLLTFSSAMGEWEVYKGDINHTQGTINIENSTYGIRVEGALSIPGCAMDTSWKELGVHKSMDLYIDEPFCSPVTGIFDDKTHIEGVSIYPNPTQGLFTIYMDEVKSDITVAIYNSIGQEILRQKITTPKTILNLQENSNGIYTIIIERGGEIITKRILKY